MNKEFTTLSTIESKPLRRDQLITLGDLLDFKSELLTDLKFICNSLVNKRNKDWLKSYEVRKLLGISPGKLQTLRNEGIIPFTRIGNVLFYNIDDINAMMDKFKNKAI